MANRMSIRITEIGDEMKCKLLTLTNVGDNVGEAVDLLPSFLSLELLKGIMLINNEQSK